MAEDDEDFAAMFEATAQDSARSRRLRAGEVVKGTVIAISEDTLFVDVGGRIEARLPVAEVPPRPNQPPVAIGDSITATVAEAGSRGAPILTIGFGGTGKRSTAELELAAASRTPVEGEFTKAVKAGIEVDIAGIRGFCPASHVEIGYAGELEVYVGQRHFFLVLEVKDGGRSVIVSRKALLEVERAREADALASRMSEGDELDGIIQTIQPYGVFVDLGGLQGMVHVSELAHGRVASPSEVVSVGDKVRVKVLSLDVGDKGQRRISLSMKALVQPPSGPTEAAEVLAGTVAKLDHHGIVVETPSGSGFVPASELGLAPGSDPRRAYSIGDAIEVVILRRDNSGKLRFSAKAVQDVQARRDYAAFRSNRGSASSFGSLGDLLRGVDLGPSGKGRQ